MTAKRLVVISGNGLSQACSPDFSSTKLAGKLREELARDEVLGKAGLDAALRLACYLDGDFGVSGAKLGFEQIVGTFDSLGRSMAFLKTLKAAGSPLADAVGPGELSDIESFCDRIYRRGTAAALKAIDEAARQVGKRSPVSDLVDLVDSSFGSAVTYATLNYDTLLLSALLAKYSETATSGSGVARSVADLGCGGLMEGVQLAGAKNAKVFALAASSDHPVIIGRPTRLINMHGSVQFWRTPHEGGYVDVKVALNNPSARGPLYEGFGKAARDDVRQRPLVIFGNQRDKSMLVKEEPFKVAYERFAKDLQDASAVLVVGYGFADEALNHVIRKQVIKSRNLDRVLVITRGPDPKEAAVKDVFCAADAKVQILRGGADMKVVASTNEWASFAQDGRG